MLQRLFSTRRRIEIPNVVMEKSHTACFDFRFSSFTQPFFDHRLLVFIFESEVNLGDAEYTIIYENSFYKISFIGCSCVKDQKNDECDGCIWFRALCRSNLLYVGAHKCLPVLLFLNLSCHKNDFLARNAFIVSRFEHIITDILLHTPTASSSRYFPTYS